MKESIALKGLLTADAYQQNVQKQLTAFHGLRPRNLSLKREMILSFGPNKMKSGACQQPLRSICSVETKLTSATLHLCPPHLIFPSLAILGLRHCPRISIRIWRRLKKTPKAAMFTFSPFVHVVFQLLVTTSPRQALCESSADIDSLDLQLLTFYTFSLMGLVGRTDVTQASQHSSREIISGLNKNGVMFYVCRAIYECHFFLS